MATNLFQPNGLTLARNRISGSNTHQANQKAIKQGYGSSIGRGDLVAIGTGGNQGYMILGTLAGTTQVGVFQGVLAYYDQTQQQTAYGLNGAYQSTSNPSADVQCLVYEDPFVTFMAQCSGGTFAQSWVGQNINFLTGTNGAPNAAGVSTLALDYTTLGLTATLPFQIIGVLGVSGGPQDPANVNPWLEVRLNTAQLLSATGI
jgi:hypothetical protein